MERMSCGQRGGGEGRGDEDQVEELEGENKERAAYVRIDRSQCNEGVDVCPSQALVLKITHVHAYKSIYTHFLAVLV